MPNTHKALIVDDEPIIRSLMKTFLGIEANILESKADVVAVGLEG